MYGNKWPRVEKALRQLGVVREMIWRVKEARAHLAVMSSTGIPLLPDFTLHNHNHSDNIILLLARLQDAFKFVLDEHEAYLSAMSAYLHDLGMFFSGERFRQEILPNPSETLRACSQSRCDRIESYQFDGKAIGTQIRETHNLLSAVMLRADPTIPIDRDDLPYLITICRGHRRANLREKGCRCYQSEPLEGRLMRVGLLAALLRLADAMDFYRDRAPKQVFEQRALDFLRNPVALKHWLKHYFVVDPHIGRQDRSGNITLVCTVNFRVGIERICGKSYLDFFRPLFAQHVKEANEKDLDINHYPSVLTQALHITAMQALLAEGELDGFRDVPEDIVRRIRESGCEDILAFLEWLQQDNLRNSNSDTTSKSSEGSSCSMRDDGSGVQV